jgi:hypothetical protein
VDREADVVERMSSTRRRYGRSSRVTAARLPAAARRLRVRAQRQTCVDDVLDEQHVAAASGQ